MLNQQILIDKIEQDTVMYGYWVEKNKYQM